MKKAKEILLTAMNTLTVDKTIIPIPLISAQEAIEKAFKIDKKKKQMVLAQLSIAKKQLKLTNILGYMSDHDVKNGYLVEHN